MFKQRTLGESIAAVGIGLHSGRKIRLVLRPAEPDTGIVFRRVDLTTPVDIPSHPLNVNDTRMATTVNIGPAAVSTIEHMMSAFNGLGIDNCIVEVNAPEIPIMDGSGASFVYLIHSAKVLEQDAPRKFVRVLSPSKCARATSGRDSSPTKASDSPSRSISDIPRSMPPCSMPTWTSPRSVMSRP